MKPKCDHTSVGIVVRDNEGRLALLKRAKFPVGIASPAGHIDDHGSAEQAAIDEVNEELGLHVEGLLQRTAIYDRRVENQCRREGGSYHRWYVFEATVEQTELLPSPDETKGADWYIRDDVQALANRNAVYHAGKLSQEEWESNPGLEDVWVLFLNELGYITDHR